MATYNSNTIRSLAASLLREGADLTDDLDCFLVLMNQRDLGLSVKEAALFLDDAVASAKRNPVEEKPRRKVRVTVSTWV